MDHYILVGDVAFTSIFDSSIVLFLPNFLSFILLRFGEIFREFMRNLDAWWVGSFGLGRERQRVLDALALAKGVFGGHVESLKYSWICTFLETASVFYTESKVLTDGSVIETKMKKKVCRLHYYHTLSDQIPLKLADLSISTFNKKSSARIQSVGRTLD